MSTLGAHQSWNVRRIAVSYVLVAMLVVLASCGGGGGGGDGGDGGSNAGNRTTFTGNLAGTSASAESTSLVASALKLVSRLFPRRAEAADVQVCVEDTTFCTLVDVDGSFTLAADVGGDVVLVFTGPDFVARVALTGIPLGATVQLRNIRCSTLTGLCEPEDLVINGGVSVRGPIRCEQGPVHIVQTGELVIEGGVEADNGDDEGDDEGDDDDEGGACIRTAGQCAVTIEADRIVLRGCEHCVRAAGGSDVTLLAGAGGIDCEAGEDGILAAGNSAVHLDGDGGLVEIHAGEDGVQSEGTAVVEIGGAQCLVEGGEHALRTNGNAEIDTSACGTLDLIGGTDEGGDDGSDEDGDGDDNDQGNGNGHGRDED